jgi:RNA polymerase sigma-70 factor (ECF subfamily)
MSAIATTTVITSDPDAYRAEGQIVRAAAGERPFETDRRRLAVLEDRALVDQVQAGNDLAFNELVDRYREKALRLVASTLGARYDVEDLVQEVFIKVYRSLDRFRGDASFSTYLYTVTVNRCRDELRRSKIRRFFSFDDWFESGGGAPELVEGNGNRLEQDERITAVRAAMKRLPPQTSMLLHLREIEEVSYKDLAVIFDVEIGTIKSRLARARDRLREELLPFMRGE